MNTGESAPDALYSDTDNISVHTHAARGTFDLRTGCHPASASLVALIVLVPRSWHSARRNPNKSALLSGLDNLLESSIVSHEPTKS